MVLVTIKWRFRRDSWVVVVTSDVDGGGGIWGDSGEIVELEEEGEGFVGEGGWGAQLMGRRRYWKNIYSIL